MKVDLRILDDRVKEFFPSYGSIGNAGLDLRACVDGPLTLEPGQVHLIPTGLSIYLADPNYAGIILPRSGTGHKQGLILGNGSGVMDSSYQGQYMVSMWNRSGDSVTINPMDRIAQLIVVPIVHLEFNVVDEFPASDRGEGGFGSTGKQ
jgi:dUTP pyrophosphatase